MPALKIKMTKDFKTVYICQVSITILLMLYSMFKIYSVRDNVELMTNMALGKILITSLISLVLYIILKIQKSRNKWSELDSILKQMHNIVSDILDAIL